MSNTVSTENKERTPLPFKRMSDVTPRRYEWLWPNRIPVGMLTLLFGDPDNGKSFITLDLATHVTTGEPWPDGSVCEQGGVFIGASEDSIEITMHERLKALGADMNRVVVYDEDGEEDKNTFTIDNPKRLADTLAMEEERGNKIRLVVIDPVPDFLGARVDMNDTGSARRALKPLRVFAKEHNVAVVMVMHMNKMESAKVIYRTAGSLGFAAVPRVSILAAKDPQDPSQGYIIPGKYNIGKRPKPLGFRFMDNEAGLDWGAGLPIDITAEELLGTGDGGKRSTPQAKPKKDTKIDAAVEFLKAKLANGPVAHAVLLMEAKKKDITPGTLGDARRKIEGVSKEVSDDFGQNVLVWDWPDRPIRSNGSQTDRLASVQTERKWNGRLKTWADRG